MARHVCRVDVLVQAFMVRAFDKNRYTVDERIQMYRAKKQEWAKAQYRDEADYEEDRDFSMMDESGDGVDASYFDPLMLDPVDDKDFEMIGRRMYGAAVNNVLTQEHIMIAAALCNTLSLDECTLQIMEIAVGLCIPSVCKDMDLCQPDNDYYSAEVADFVSGQLERRMRVSSRATIKAAMTKISKRRMNDIVAGSTKQQKQQKMENKVAVLFPTYNSKLLSVHHYIMSTTLSEPIRVFVAWMRHLFGAIDSVYGEVIPVVRTIPTQANMNTRMR